MKQDRLMQWIEAAEARSVCLLAEEGRTSTWPKPRPTDPLLARLRKQLCVGEVSRLVARFYRVRSAALMAIPTITEAPQPEHKAGPEMP